MFGLLSEIFILLATAMTLGAVVTSDSLSTTEKLMIAIVFAICAVAWGILSAYMVQIHCGRDNG